MFRRRLLSVAKTGLASRLALMSSEEVQRGMEKSSVEKDESEGLDGFWREDGERGIGWGGGGIVWLQSPPYAQCLGCFGDSCGRKLQRGMRFLLIAQVTNA